MDLFVLSKQKRNHYNLSLGVVQAPPRVQQEISSTLTSSPTPNMATRKDSDLSSQVNNGSPNSSSVYPLECSAFNFPFLCPNACIYSILEEVIQFQHQWDTPSFGWGSSSLDGISSSIIGMHEPSGGAQYTSKTLLEGSRSDHK